MPVKICRLVINIILSLLLAGLLLLTAEAIVRFAGIGQPISLFIPAPDQAPNTFVVNPSFYAAYFPREYHESFETSSLWDWSISKEKAAETIRIFVFGGSVALGDVPDVAFNFPRILECMLAASFPKLNFEVYNLACVALNSHVMRLAAQEAAQFSPDFFVVYMGNNEYIGPYGPAWYPNGLPPCSRAIERQEWFRRFHLMNLLNRALAKSTPSLPNNVASFFSQSYKLHYDSPGRERMYLNFQANLEAICHSAANVKANVLLCTVGNNLRDIPPFYSLNRASMSAEECKTWEYHYRRGITFQKTDGPDNVLAAIASFMEAYAIDSGHADLLYRLGRCHLAVDNPNAALDYFIAARNADAFPIRADTRINDVIREIAGKIGQQTILLADVESLFSTLSSDGIMGYGYFYDSVHVLFEGNYIIASSVFDAATDYIIEKTGTAPVRTKLSINECEERLGLSPLLKADHLQQAIDEAKNYQEFHPAIQIKPLEERLRVAMENLGDNAFHEALRSLETALSFRGQDAHIERLMAELVSKFTRDNDGAH